MSNHLILSRPERLVLARLCEQTETKTAHFGLGQKTCMVALQKLRAEGLADLERFGQGYRWCATQAGKNCCAQQEQAHDA